MKITHIWQHYSPNLFDKSHPMCLEHGISSEVICQAFIQNGAPALPNTFCVRQRDPAESNKRNFFVRVFRRSLLPIDLSRFARLVISRTNKFPPDVLHLHFGTTAAALEEFSALPNVPMVISFYGVDISESLRDKNILKAYRSIFKKANILHVLCDEAQSRLIEIGCPIEKIRICNLPANLENIPEIRSDATKTTRFLIPARFVEKKGHLVLLRAFKTLVDSGANVSLTCFGYGPSDWLERIVIDWGLIKSVKIINNNQSPNFIADYIDLLHQHDVVMAPSVRSSSGDDEGGPALTLVMAQAAGKPVIVSDFPGSERSVADGVHGFVVAAGDSVALSQAMRQMLSNPILWNRLGKAGRCHVLTEFSDATYWENIHSWYLTASRSCS